MTATPRQTLSPSQRAHSELASSDEFVAFLRIAPTPCPACHIPLNPATTTACPACNAPLLLTVGLVKPKLKLWLLMTVPLLCLAGAGLFFTVFLLAAFRLPDGREAVVYYLYIAAIPLAIVALTTRRLFNRLPLIVRSAFTILSVLYLVIAFGYFASFLR